MRRSVTMFAAVIAAVAVVAGATPRPALAQETRALFVAAVAGARSFDSVLDLETEAALGLRFGVGVSERVTIWMDALYSAPSRRATGGSASVTALRALAEVRLTRGPIRPYLLVGGGGMLFEFDDLVRDAGGGEVTLGGGLEYRAGSRTALFAEWSADLYRAQMTVYDSYGNIAATTPRRTESATTIAGGLSVRF